MNVARTLLLGLTALALCGQLDAQDFSSQNFSTTAPGEEWALVERLPPVTGAEEVPPPELSDSITILQALPQPPLLPASLAAPMVTAPPRDEPAGRPYFVPDLFLDGGPFRQPGWFAGVEVAALKPLLITQTIVQDPADRAAGNFYRTNVPSATLNWAASPRVYIGYRLPSGFGELSVAYRNLQSSGSTTTNLLDGPTSLASNLRFDLLDFDYSNNEFTFLPNWEMRWTAGLRLLWLSYNSQAQQPAGQAATGSGILTEQVFNHTFGVGPHVGVQLARHFKRDPRWSLFVKTDGASVFTNVTDGYQSTTLNAGYPPLYPNTTDQGHQTVPVLFAQAGIAWQPSAASQMRLFLGYQYEHYWALNIVSPTGNNPPSTGQIEAQGVTLQGTWRY